MLYGHDLADWDPEVHVTLDEGCRRVRPAIVTVVRDDFWGDDYESLWA